MARKVGKGWLVACLILAALIAGVVFGGIPQLHTNAESSRTYRDITPEEFDAAIGSRNPFVVDVHIPEQAHLPGTDAFIPYSELETRLAELPPDKGSEILVYCRSGSMSTQASQVLIEAGYTNVANLSGGVQAWQAARPPLTLTPAAIDLGTVLYGEVRNTQFILANNTAETVTLTRVSTSCSCTQAQAGKTQLGPYESTAVEVSFDPAVHRDDSDLGTQTKTIFVKTDNPSITQLEADIEAFVIKKT